MKPPFKNPRIRQDSEETQNIAFNYSLKYVSMRSRSLKEVFDYLSRKKFAEDTINAVLKRLVDMKFLNDDDFAHEWVRSRQKYRNKSKLIIKNELRLKGINIGIIEQTLKDADDDLEIARVLFEKKKRSLGSLPKEEFRRKMANFLQRRGFSYEVISKLLR